MTDTARHARSRAPRAPTGRPHAECDERAPRRQLSSIFDTEVLLIVDALTNSNAKEIAAQYVSHLMTIHPTWAAHMRARLASRHVLKSMDRLDARGLVVASIEDMYGVRCAHITEYGNQVASAIRRAATTAFKRWPA